MLDTITDTTETVATTQAKFTETEARAYLAEHPSERSARKLEPIFGWHRSSIQRLLSRLSETQGETAAGPTPHEFRNLLVEATKDFDAKFPPESAKAAVDRALAEGKVKAPSDTADDDGEKDHEHFRPDDPLVVFYEQPATCCYWNVLEQVIIRQERSHWEDDDSKVRFARENLPRLIQRLQRMYDEGVTE